MTTRRNAACSIAIGILVAATAGRASALESATGTISATPLGGGEFQYNIALKNTSSDGSDIGTFWFSWIPGHDFMEALPTNITFPTGWSVNITGSNNSSDGNALQFLAGPLLTPGNTDDFSFESTETLAQITGPSSYTLPDNETTSFIYHAAPFSDAGSEFTLTPVPEPVSATVMAIGGAGLLMRRRRA
ncbi:MAG: hypothetical protein ABSB74_14200 [Tepidisphaeraceae bacterium]